MKYRIFPSYLSPSYIVLPVIPVIEYPDFYLLAPSTLSIILLNTGFGVICPALSVSKLVMTRLLGHYSLYVGLVEGLLRAGDGE
jgi:hypothetical protein